MSSSLTICDIHPDVVAKTEIMRKKKDKKNAALVLKIDKVTKMVNIDEELHDCTLDEVKDELSEHQPRYFIYSFCFKHQDGRVSYPLCLVHVQPEGCQPELTMMYAGTKNALTHETKMTKAFDIRDMEDISEEWLAQKLSLK